MLQALIKPVIGPAISKVLDLIPNSNERARAKEEIEREQLQQITAQLEINKEEAKHKSVFVAGWRPFIGWVCGIGVLYSFIIQPLLITLLTAFNLVQDFNVPDLATEHLFSLVLALLGMGGLRTWEKSKGVASRGLK